MTDIEIALTDLGEVATRELAKQYRPTGLEDNKKIAREGGNVAKVARNDLENKLGRSVISKDNSLTYQYSEKEQLIDNKSYFNS